MRVHKNQGDQDILSAAIKARDDFHAWMISAEERGMQLSPAPWIICRQLSKAIQEEQKRRNEEKLSS